MIWFSHGFLHHSTKLSNKVINFVLSRSDTWKGMKGSVTSINVRNYLKLIQLINKYNIYSYVGWCVVFIFNSPLSFPRDFFKYSAIRTGCIVSISISEEWLWKPVMKSHKKERFFPSAPLKYENLLFLCKQELAIKFNIHLDILSGGGKGKLKYFVPYF